MGHPARYRVRAVNRKRWFPGHQAAWLIGVAGFDVSSVFKPQLCSYVLIVVMVDVGVPRSNVWKTLATRHAKLERDGTPV
jgi:hypothetical protein